MYTGISSSPVRFIEFARSNGFFRLWRGGGAVLLGCVPSHAAYFSAYEFGKVHLGVDQPGHHPVAAAATGATATLLHDAVSSPMDLVKQRLQLGYYRGVAHCVRELVASSGPLSLWRSLPATLALNVPYAATCVAVNESAKLVFMPLLGREAISTYLLSGACAGAAAAAITTPLDVLKTRMQTQGLGGGGATPLAPLCGSCDDTARTTLHSSSHTPSARETFSVALDQWRSEGFRGFFKGVRARVAVNAPSQAISWAAYESMKSLLLPLLGGGGGGGGARGRLEE